CTSAQVVVPFLAFFSSFAFAAESFDAIQSRADHMGETPQGKTYEKQFRAAIGALLRDALETCTKNTNPPYTVNLVFTIVSNGSVRHIVPAPQQPVSRCVVQQLTGVQVPPPPKNDWLVAMKITVKD